MDKKPTKEALLDCLKLLCKKFPKAFNIHQPKPLKINIHEDIKRALKKHKIDENVLQLTLKIYMNKVKYLQATLNNTYRINLYGDQGKNKIQPKHKEYAKQKLEEIQQKASSKN